MRIIDSYNRFNNWSVNTTVQGQATSATATEKNRTAESSRQGTASAKGDAVDVSAQAVELAQKAAAEADAAKVEKLRSAIQDGSFVIDHQAIANRIVDGG